MILGLSRPDAGTVEVFGQAPRDAVAHGLVAAVMQTGGLLKDLTVARDPRAAPPALFAAHPAGRRGAGARPGIADIADRRVGKCSGGQQQRLRFAMALLPDPELLILDEPTTGMDVEGRRDFWSAIRDDAERGRTVLFATHYLEEADAYADRIVLVSHGRIVADGTAAQIKALAAGRTGHAPPGRTSAPPTPRCAACPGSRTSSCAATPSCRAADSDAVARHLLTATPARDLRDHLARARGRLPRPDRETRPMSRRRLPPSPTRRVPPLGGFSLTFLRLEIRRHAAQPPHRDLHPDHAAGVLPALRRPSDAYRTRPPAAATSSAYLMISFAVYGVDARHHQRAAPRSPSSGRWAGPASCG